MKAPRLAAVLAAPVLLLAACGDEEASVVETGGPEAVMARLQAAPEAMAEAGSARMEMTMTMAAMGESFEITAEGGFDGDQATFTMDFGEVLGGLGGLGAAPGETVPEGFDDPMTIVVDGTTTYMKVPMMAMFTGTDGWLSVTAEDMGLAEDSLGLGFGASGNPAQLVESLRGVSEEIEELGSEEVRGVDTTRYRVVVDLEKAAAELPEDAREAYEQQVSGLGVSTLPFEVWVSDEGLVHRMAMDFADLIEQAPPEEVEGFESGTMVLELFDHGADLDIELPDPSEVTPFSEVMGGFGMDPGAIG
ncbi:MAG: hypothetical protein ACO1PW_00055 [Actinomycetota bacterium]